MLLIESRFTDRDGWEVPLYLIATFIPCLVDWHDEVQLVDIYFETNVSS
jgi:hypothetical protein